MVQIEILQNFQALFERANIDTQTVIKEIVLEKLDPVSKYNASALEILTFLNKKRKAINIKSRGFTAVRVNLDFIVARLKEGATVTECKQIIAMKVQAWRAPEWQYYLRPATLFNRTKFWQYHGELRTVETTEGEQP